MPTKYFFKHPIILNTIIEYLKLYCDTFNANFIDRVSTNLSHNKIQVNTFLAFKCKHISPELITTQQLT